MNLLVGDPDTVMDGKQRKRSWRRGLRSALDSLPRRPNVLVLGDPPKRRRGPPACLLEHPTDISAYVLARGHAELPAHDAERRAAMAAGATFRSLAATVRSYGPRAVLVNELLAWRNDPQITGAFAQQFAPSAPDHRPGCAQGARHVPYGRIHGRTSVRLASLVALLLLGTTPVTRGSTGDTDGDELRDAFESRWRATDPMDRDTDDDGVRDAAEDRDGDGLSDLGEQRYGTSPMSVDSDGDGLRDGREDSDGDGVDDAREQDRRPVPRPLRPSLGDALHDQPGSYRNGCHSGPYEQRIHPCVFGDRDGSLRITLFGDSHALQWVPALTRGAEARRWRVTVLTKSACPSVHVVFQQPVFPGATRSCERWRAEAEAWLRTHAQDLIIISNSGGYRVIDRHGRRLRGSERKRRWRNGLAQTLRAMPNGTRLLVLGDTPKSRVNVPVCLRANRNLISACVTGRSRAMRESHDAVERAAATANGATFRSLNRQLCPYDPCPVVVNELLIWRDASHITATYARQLAPSMRSIVQEVLADSEDVGDSGVHAPSPMSRMR